MTYRRYEVLGTVTVEDPVILNVLHHFIMLYAHMTQKWYPFRSTGHHPAHLAHWSERRHVVSGGEDVPDIPAVHHRYQPLPADLFGHQDIGAPNHWNNEPLQHHNIETSKEWNIKTLENSGTCKTLEHQNMETSKYRNINTSEHQNIGYTKIVKYKILEHPNMGHIKCWNIKILEQKGHDTKIRGHARDIRGVGRTGRSVEHPPPASQTALQ